jgi:hypothetical protein
MVSRIKIGPAKFDKPDFLAAARGHHFGTPMLLDQKTHGR